MKWKPVIEISNLDRFKGSFGSLYDGYLFPVVARALHIIEKILGFPIGVEVPFDLDEFEDDQESQRAIRILSRLRKRQIIKNFYTEIQPYPDEPRGFVTKAQLTLTDRFGFSGKGAHLTSRAATLWPALGEAVERHAMQDTYVTNEKNVDASWNQLPGNKADIFKVAGFDEKLRKQEHRNFALEFSKDSQFRWTQTKELPSGKAIWAPLQWFSFDHVQKFCIKGKEIPDDKVEPLLSVPITTGAAAGQDTTDAILRGLLEVIERDAFIIYWLNQIPADHIDIDSFNEERFDKLKVIAEDFKLETHLLYLKTDVPVHTVCSIVIDRTGIGPALIIGSKTSTSLSDAAYGVFGETLVQRGTYRKMKETYFDAYTYSGNPYDFNHVERMLFWFDQKQLVHVEKFISGTPKPVSSFPEYSYSNDNHKDLSQLLRFFSKKQYQVMYKEVLDPNLQKLTEGMSVVMVKVPQMQPVYLEESLQCLGGERLNTVPEYLGYQRKKDTSELFVAVPHPFP